MKKLLFVLISSLASISLTAQNKPSGITKFYVDGEVTLKLGENANEGEMLRLLTFRHTKAAVKFDNEPREFKVSHLGAFTAIVLVSYKPNQFATYSILVFAFMVPYGLFVRLLAVRAVRAYVTAHPETLVEFQTEGIISTKP